MVIHVTFNDSHFVEEIVKKVRSFLRVTHHQFMQMWKNKKKKSWPAALFSRLRFVAYRKLKQKLFFSFLSLVKFNIL